MKIATQAVWPGSPTREHGPESRATQAHAVFAKCILPLVLILLYAAQCAWFISTQSFTIDEPLNIDAGLAQWHGNPSMASDNPPGARLLCSLPLLGSRSGAILATDLDLDPGYGLDPFDVAWRTRSMNVLLGIALGIALWMTARRYFSVGAANFALALFAFSPPVIAHFSIVGTDGIAALMIFLTAVQVARFRRNPTWRQAVLTGAVLGGLLLAKLYTLPMFALALLLMVLPSRAAAGGKNSAATAARRWNWSKAAVALCLSFVLLWMSYGFDAARLVAADGKLWVERPGARVTEPVDFGVNNHFNIRLPAADYIYSIAFQLHHGEEGHESYLLGKVSTHGWRKYFPLAIILKWPTVVLLLALAAAVAIASGRLRLPPEAQVMALFPAVFFLLAIFSTVNIGDRYVLAVYPFVLLLASALWERVGRRRAAVAALVLAAALNAADARRYAPDYLSYFTVFVPAEQSWRYLSDSSLDWGQSLIALRDYQHQHPGEVLHVAFWTNAVAPELYGLDVAPFGEEERPSGTVIVSPGVLSGQLNQDQQAYRWVLQYPRKAILNHTLLVFEVPPGSNRD